VGSQTLRLPLRSPKLSFDPRGLRPLDSLGTVYGNLRITESWGILEAPEGGLIAPDWTAVTVFVGPASGFREFRPEAWRQDTLRGVYGWKLVLDPAWEVRPDSTTGSLRVTRR
jgi:hypothetical protein